MIAEKMEKARIQEEISRIRDEYKANDICIAELLADITVPQGLTYEEAFSIYISSRKWADGDLFFIDRGDGSPEEL